MRQLSNTAHLLILLKPACQGFARRTMLVHGSTDQLRTLVCCLLPPGQPSEEMMLLALHLFDLPDADLIVSVSLSCCC
jgi:hypothetical protein